MQEPFKASPADLREARLNLFEGKLLPVAWDQQMDMRVVQSWKRSVEAGLSPRPFYLDDLRLSASALKTHLEQHHELMRHARPVMDHLYETLHTTHSMVILANPEGILLETVGNPHFLTKAQQVALGTGASWHEHHRGTNAIGTALAERTGIEIHGAEHFFDPYQFLTCAAAPILSGLGKVVGVLDISGEHSTRHPHSLSLVNTAVKMIENKLLTANIEEGQIHLHFYPTPEGIGTVAEGILVCSEEGIILGANRQALAFLGLSFSEAFDYFPLFKGMRLPLTALPFKKRGVMASFYLNNRLFYGISTLSRSTPLRSFSAQTFSQPTDPFEHLNTGDARWAAAVEKAKKIAGKSIPIILSGESGVGKEVFAQAIHVASGRKGAFIAINCAALPEHLIEAELFGYTAGAFTGAKKEGYIGRIREAEGGTLFLDEIGDMPILLQSRLLRVLQERVVTPLGGGRPVPVSFDLISATHCQLKQAVEKGSFRADLYYRLNGFMLTLPSLRERTDLVSLIKRLLTQFAPDLTLTIEKDLLARFAHYAWPGNIRQFSNVLKTAIVLLNEDETEISWAHLSEDSIQELTTTTQPVLSPATSLNALSKQAILNSLETHKGNVSQAAKQLGISRQTLYRKLEEWN